MNVTQYFSRKIHSFNHIRQYSKYVSLFTESDIRNPKASYDNEDFSDFLAKIFILQPPNKYEI